ncbi:MAG TPA: aminotransferase class I/II-fold pyridoxal phosphate-dependent enzyme, partial [Thermoanaerobaculia bacterium]|nr:aminotransferase class I/II-fold pyridoxal phosphate-dependent enzyme [Thermoanaerobaculia bacterium]
KLPYSLNVVSETIAALALEKRAYCETNVAEIIAERERMLAVMRSRGIPVFPTKANFIAFRSPVTFEDFLDAGILVRKYADFLRVSVGTREENEQFLRVILRREDAEGPSRVLGTVEGPSTALGMTRGTEARP